MTSRLPVLLLAFVLAPTATAASAQDPDTPAVPVDSVIVDPDTPLTTLPVEPDAIRPISPRAAFIGSMILPGWGQAAFESYFRGGVYFTGWAGNWLMIFRTSTRLQEARLRYDIREGQLRDELIAGASDPDSMRLVLDTTDLLEATVLEDSLANDHRRLVLAREQQREDWIAWSIFWVLASGIDAYVTAHLSDFPVGIDIQPYERSVSLRLEVPLPRRRR